MNTKRPVILTIATILLVVLVLFSSGLALARNFGLVRQNFGGAGFAGRRFAAGGGQGNFPQGGFNNAQPGTLPGSGAEGGTGTFQLPGNINPNNPNAQTNPNFQNFQGRGTGGASGLMGIFRLATMVLNISALVLGLVAAFGLWKQKKWAAVLAIILASLLLLTSLTGFTVLLRFFAPLAFAESFFKVLLAAAVIVLLLLPASRHAYSALAPEDDLAADL
jgi:hypothetical protein